MASPDGVAVDRANLVYYSISFVGLVILLPWNILITVSGFWAYKFREVHQKDDFNQNLSPNASMVTYDDGSEPLTDLQKVFASYLSIAANVPNATFIILHALFGHKLDMHARIMGSQLGQLVVFTAITVLARLDTDQWQDVFLITSLVLIALLNAFSAVFQGSVFANAGKFPVQYMGNLNTGTGLGGVLPAIVNVLILAMGADANNSGFLCFLFADIMAMACLVLVCGLRTNPFYQHFTRINEVEELPLVQHVTLPTLMRVANDCKLYLISNMLIFVVTLAMFPAVTVLVQPVSASNSAWSKTFFVPVVCFVLFNVGDLVGKNLAVRIQWPDASRSGQIWLFLLCLSRLIFIPLFAFCNVAPGARNTPVLIHSDWAYGVIMALFSVSNGYLTNVAMMFAPKVANREHQEVASAIMIAVLVLGCGAGSLLSAPIVRLL